MPLRGLICGAGVLLFTVWFVDLRCEHTLWVLAFALLGSGIMGVLGIIAGIFWLIKIGYKLRAPNIMKRVMRWHDFGSGREARPAA